MTLAKTNNPRFSTAYRKSSLEDRFKMSYIKNTSGCWLWIGHTNNNPDPRFRYGTMVQNKNRILAHRFSWELTNGRKIPTGMFVCHKCDVPKCVNPDHLFLGDSISNIEDRESKGRGPQGERNWCTKLTEEDIPIIKQLHRDGAKQQEIARKFNVSQGAISNIVNNQTWKHLIRESI